MFLAQLFNILSGDLQYINELVEVIADDQFGYTVKKELAEFTLGEIDQNLIISSILYRINRDVFSQIQQQIENDTIEVSNEAEKETLLSLCQERIDEFSPSINSIVSEFGNELDQVTIRGNTVSQIVDEVMPLLLEDARN